MKSSASTDTNHKEMSMDKDSKDVRAVGALQIAYMELLKMPHDSVVRIRNQHLLCVLRDAIAAETGTTAQQVQDCFESMELKVRLAA